MAKYLIIGGVAGGATTAARLRRVDENGEIIMFERGPHISYANCGLPYYIGGVIKEREKLLVQTPESFSARFNIDVRVRNEVVGIFPDSNEIEVHDIVSDKTYRETYDKLVLSPGAKPVNLPVLGADLPNIFTLRNVEDTDKIKSFVDEEKPYSAVLIGAGFIGLEMAENLYHRGIKVTVVEAAPQVMNMFDPEMASLIHQHFKEKEVALYLGDGVDRFEKNDQGTRIVLASGKEIDADFVIQSVGVKPDIEIMKKAGIETGERGGIKIDEYFQTNYEGIYAVGDCIEFPNPVTGISSFSYLAGPANKQGRMLADNLAYGHKKEYNGSIGTAIAKLFDITVGITGVSEKSLQSANIAYHSTIINAGSHAGYYPDAMPLTIKIIFSPEGVLYGAQVVGYKGVDKRIDILATIVRTKGTIYDLQEIEHSYAPPFSSAKDPVNQIGFNAENILKNMFKPLSPYEFHDRDKTDAFVLDVRTPEEVSLGPVKGAYNIEIDEIRNRIDEIPKDKKIFAFCGVGLRGYVVCRVLVQKGYDAYNLSGGLKVYKAATDIQSNEIAFKPQLISSKKEKAAEANEELSIKTIEVDACGLQCPGPIMKLKKEIDKIQIGERIKEVSTDPGFFRDVKSWCDVTGNKLINVSNDAGKVTAIVEKGDNENKGVKVMDNGDSKTIVVFSDDLDRALASFVIANGAASMGKKVTMFFTFWGLNIIKKPKKPSVKKDFMGKMFGMMMASSSKKLSLSKMNMMGMGSVMMRKRMKNKNVDALETMINNAVESGVNLISCQMSMDVMGVDKEELIEEVEVGGVANYLSEAESSNVNLFI